MRILALDLSTTNIGWVISLPNGSFDHNTITPYAPKDSKINDRLVAIADALQQIFELQDPTHVAYEAQSKYGPNSFAHSYVIGLMLVLALRRGITPVPIAPTTGKKALTGHGTADKAAMVLAAYPHLGTCTDHEADALGVLFAFLTKLKEIPPKKKLRTRITKGAK